MYVVVNNYAVALTVFALFAGLFVAASLGAGDPETVRRYFPYALGAWMIVLDLTIRAFEWRKIVAKAKGATLITREGPVAAPRRRFRELLEAIFGIDAGGQFFFVIPAWLVGAGVVILATSWKAGWLSPP